MSIPPARRARFFALILALFVASAASIIPASATPALVVDADTQAVLYADDAGRPWYPTSTTKLMTAFVTFEALAAGEVTLDTPVVMSPKAMHQESLHAGLSVRRAMRLEDAFYAAFAASANDVAIALAQMVAGNEKAFVERMNVAAQRLGMSASHFANANGLFDPTQHVSARDLAVLALTLDARFPQYRPIFRTSRVIIDGTAVDSFNVLLTRFPGAEGMKTGFLCAAGRNIVALAERNGHRVMTVLLGATMDHECAERAAKLLTEAFAGKLKPTGVNLSALRTSPRRRRSTYACGSVRKGRTTTSGSARRSTRWGSATTEPISGHRKHRAPIRSRHERYPFRSMRRCRGQNLPYDNGPSHPTARSGLADLFHHARQVLTHLLGEAQGIERLGDDADRPQREEPFDLISLRAGGDENDRSLLRRLDVAQPLQGFRPVHSRHHHVEQDDFGPKIAHLGQGLGARGTYLDFQVGIEPERERGDLTNIVFIIDIENTRLAFLFMLSPAALRGRGSGQASLARSCAETASAAVAASAGRGASSLKEAFLEM